MEWRPINTALKDDSEVLVASAGADDSVRIAIWSESMGCYTDVYLGLEEINPTHWMPMPAAPES